MFEYLFTDADAWMHTNNNHMKHGMYATICTYSKHKHNSKFRYVHSCTYTIPPLGPKY